MSIEYQKLRFPLFLIGYHSNLGKGDIQVQNQTLGF